VRDRPEDENLSALRVLRFSIVCLAPGLSHVRTIGMRLDGVSTQTPLVLVGMAQADPAETVSGFRQIGTLFRESILIIRVLLT
jgi:hypothetical protein